MYTFNTHKKYKRIYTYISFWAFKYPSHFVTRNYELWILFWILSRTLDRLKRTFNKPTFLNFSTEKMAHRAINFWRGDLIGNSHGVRVQNSHSSRDFGGQNVSSLSKRIFLLDVSRLESTAGEWGARVELSKLESSAITVCTSILPFMSARHSCGVLRFVRSEDYGSVTIMSSIAKHPERLPQAFVK